MEYIEGFWLWPAVLMILTAILFGLSYKWKWAMAVFAGVIGAFGGIILMSLLYLTVGTLVVGALCHFTTVRLTAHWQAATDCSSMA